MVGTFGMNCLSFSDHSVLAKCKCLQMGPLIWDLLGSHTLRRHSPLWAELEHTPCQELCLVARVMHVLALLHPSIFLGFQGMPAGGLHIQQLLRLDRACCPCFLNPLAGWLPHIVWMSLSCGHACTSGKHSATVASQLARKCSVELSGAVSWSLPPNRQTSAGHDPSLLSHTSLTLG